VIIMKLKKWIFLIAGSAFIIAIGFLLNLFFGNPISKKAAEQEALSYFEDKYNKDFTVYSSSYNYLIPDYNIKMGPSEDSEAVFDTSRYQLTRFDAYGAYLASKKLESNILKIIRSEYPDLNMTVKVYEDHNTEIPSIEFDFFSTNPKVRLEKNYFMAEVTWVENAISNDEAFKLMDEISLKINNELKGTPKQLSWEFYLKQPISHKVIIERYYNNGEAIIKN
jgi:hypothetical protein